MEVAAGTAPQPHAHLALDGPVLFFGGCYSNLEATLALRREAARLGIPPDNIVCTGDVVAYCADPLATVDAVRDWGVHTIMGNCEESLGWSRDDCGCGFEEGTACEVLSIDWYAYANGALGDEQRVWMRSLPRRLDVTISNRRLAVIHGSVESINRFVFASTPWVDKEHQITKSGCHGVVGGHSGIPFSHAAGGKLWHNSGALGMPANDGTARVWFSLFHSQRRWHRRSFDAPAVRCQRHGTKDARPWPAARVCGGPGNGAVAELRCPACRRIDAPRQRPCA